MNKKLPDIFYNWISAIGAFISGSMLVVIILLLLIDFFVHKTTMYLGLLTYTLLPVFVVFGFALILIGALRERHRLAQGKAPSILKSYTIDFENPRHRNVIVITLVGIVLFLFGTSVGTYKAYHMTESTAFCGMLCHSVMRPEHTAYQVSAHARVACVECHIGPGAGWFVKSKLSGMYQVYATLAKKYPRPIPTPIENLRPARETCLQCHWPEKFFGARRVVFPHYLSDEQNTPYPISLLVNIGGGSEKSGHAEGIHWHMAISNKIEYIARDRDRIEMAWVRVTRPDGTSDEYNLTDNPLTPAELSKAKVRRLDCIDCHNRPSHNYRSPLRSVNEAMSIGRIARTLPFIKRETVRALDAEYGTTDEAVNGIGQKLKDFYKVNYPEIYAKRGPEIDASIENVRAIYRQNFFPEMGVSWRKYPDHIGHFQSAGCFRCHGSGLATKEGKTISKNCMLCHSILSQGGGQEASTVSSTGLKFKHPVDIGGMETEGNCSSCHSGGAELY